MEAKVEEKMLFTFKIYDVDGDGFISNADLYKVLKAMVGNNLSDTQLQQLVDRTILKGKLKPLHTSAFSACGASSLTC